MNHTAGARPAASPSKAGVPDASRPLDTGAVTKRLQQELMSLMASGGDGVSAFPAGDSLFDWVGTINVSRGRRCGLAGVGRVVPSRSGCPSSALLLGCSPCPRGAPTIF